MVKKLTIYVFILITLPVIVEAKPQLLLLLDKTEIQLGQHINAKLYGIDLKKKLIDVDLSVLNKNYGVSIVETIEEAEDNRWPDRSVQLVQLKLFPRTLGNYELPEIFFDGVKTSARTIFTKPNLLSTGNINSNISRVIKISSTHPWEREQMLVKVEFTTTDTYASVYADDLIIPGFDVFPLPIKSKKKYHDGTEYSIVMIGWALFPLLPGQYNIDIPAVEYRKNGRTQYTFYQPRQLLNVKPLPAYIPPTMPVGKINISSQIEDYGPLYPETLAYWNVSIESDQASPNWIPSLAQQLQSREDIEFFQKSSKKIISANEKGVTTQIVHHIPFKALSSGSKNLPTLNLQYFDPGSGRIMSTTANPQGFVAISHVWRTLIFVLAILFISFTGRYIYLKTTEYIQHKKRIKQALLKIENAECFPDLRNALRNLSDAEGWPKNLTIREWTAKWIKYSNQNNNVEKLMKQLSRACYSNNYHDDFETYRSQLISCLRHRD